MMVRSSWNSFLTSSEPTTQTNKHAAPDHSRPTRYGNYFYGAGWPMTSDRAAKLHLPLYLHRSAIERLNYLKTGCTGNDNLAALKGGHNTWLIFTLILPKGVCIYSEYAKTFRSSIWEAQTWSIDSALFFYCIDRSEEEADNASVFQSWRRKIVEVKRADWLGDVVG